MAVKTLVVMVSSTVRDLPEHRQGVMDACLRQGMLPKMMEHLPASDDGGLAVSLKLVDEADIYVGVFAHRYGSVPKGKTKSITHYEYERATARGIPRLIFIMHDDHLIRKSDVEMCEGAKKLDQLKSKLKTGRNVNFFKSPEELRAQVIQALAAVKEMVADAVTPDARSFLHYVSDIPAPPEPYIAHPYTLLQTRGLIGRKEQLNFLTDWIVKPEKTEHARILCVVALGGVGKSALTWKFFHDVLPHEMTPLAGRIWWSFYESDAHFDNFVIRALAYVSGRSREEITRDLTPPEREAQLLADLAKQPFFVVLDGLERILVTYARMDAAHLDDAAYDQQTANYVAGAHGLPEGAGPAFVGQQRLRATADLRAGQFLRKLATLPETGSKILVSTRLYPAELQSPNRSHRSGCFALFLPGLCDDDALELWRTLGAGGSRETLVPMFNRFVNHPLLIQALAGEVAANLGKPGDFDHWRAKRRDFDPFQFEHLVQVKSHILEHALRGLDPAQRQVLHTLAAFRMPASYDTLVALLVRSDDEADSTARQLLADEVALDRALIALADRGLLGWDNRPGVNRYDLHPIVRGVVWGTLNRQDQTDLYTALHNHFESLPVIDYEQVNSLEDLTPAIELFYTLIGLERFEDAFKFFRERLNDVLLFRLNANRHRGELVEWFFPDGPNGLPRLSRAEDQGFALNALTQGYHEFFGQPGSAVPILRRAVNLVKHADDRTILCGALYDLSDALRLSGGIRKAEASARDALITAREIDDRHQEGVGLQNVGLALLVRGEPDDAAALQRSLRIWIARGNRQGESFVNALLAERALWRDNPAAARPLADRAWELAKSRHVERDFILVAHLQGTAALYLGDFGTADERIHHALRRARACNVVQEELPALVALAELHRRRGEPERAREVLDDVWETAERGPYPPFHADALNVLARIERDAGHRDAAVEAATRAYKLAWCDGPPFAYHWGLMAAKAHLAELGAPEPALPPFDESELEPMPEVEINPPDEFSGDDDSQ